MSQALDPTGIKAIIFDIGNVIIDIDYDVMVSEFRKIAKYDFREIINYTHQDGFFDLFEKGKISVPDFRRTLRQYLVDGITDEQIDQAWNSILVAYPHSKFERLKQLRTNYKLYALSNINEIHVVDIDKYVRAEFKVPDMRAYFDHAFYSHEMGTRKPEREIYSTVLSHIGFEPSQLLFIDDKAENTEAAAPFGIQTHHLKDRDTLLPLLSLF